MRLVEQHVIKRGDPRYQRLDEAAFASKNLWNAANYLVRQFFIFQGVYLNNTAVFHLLKEHEAYQALPRKVSNQVLIQLHKAWVGFFEAMEEWREHPERFTGRPKLPGYKAELVGIQVILTEESYTSRASFLDRDEIPVYDPACAEEPRFSGRRDGRWYYASGKRIIHADVNGSYNIGRKVIPTAFDGPGVAAPAVRPRRLAV